MRHAVLAVALLALTPPVAVAGDLADAEALARLVETSPFVAEVAATAFRRAAERALDDFEYETAVDAATRATRLAPGNAGIWTSAARVCAATGLAYSEEGRSGTDIRLMYDDAERCARRALELDREVRGAHRVLADAALSRLDDPDGKTNAIGFLRAEVAVAPDDADSWWKLGELLFRDAKDHAGAAAALRGCVKADPTRVLAWRWLGTALEYARDSGEAADAYLAALILDPGDAYAFDRLWRCGVSDPQTREGYVGAVRNLARWELLRGEPDVATAHLHRVHAWVLGRAGRTDEAVAKLRALIERFPDHDVNRHYLGDVLLDAGRTEEGVALFRRAIEADPNAAHPFARLMRHGFETGDLALMEWLWEQRPDADLANNIGFHHRDTTRDYEASLRWYLRASELAPENPDILNDTGLIYHYHRHDFDRAIAFYDRAVAAARANRPDEIADPAAFEKALAAGRPVRGYVDALENLATLAVARGEWAKARAWLESLLELQPDRIKALGLLKAVEANE